MKILPVGVKLFHANTQTDRQTDMTKLIIALRNFGRGLKTQQQKKTINNAETDVEKQKHIVV